jgi:hypothetical protein
MTWYRYNDSKKWLFIETTSENMALAIAKDTGEIGLWDDEDVYFYPVPSGASFDTGAPQGPPARGENVRTMDLGGRYTAKDYAKDKPLPAHVYPEDGEFYIAWQDGYRYVNEAVYGGENGYGVRVWERSVSNVFPVSAVGWDESGNQSAPVHGQPTAFSTAKPVPLGTGFMQTQPKSGYWSCWFPTEEDAKAFRNSVHKWQAKLPKFDPKEHV